MIKVGDKIKINLNACQDMDVISWCMDNGEVLLTVTQVEEDVNGIWVKNCPYRIDMDEVIIEVIEKNYVCLKLITEHDDSLGDELDYVVFREGHIYKGTIRGNYVFFNGENKKTIDFKLDKIQGKFVEVPVSDEITQVDIDLYTEINKKMEDRIRAYMVKYFKSNGLTFKGEIVSFRIIKSDCYVNIKSDDLIEGYSFPAYYLKTGNDLDIDEIRRE